LGVVECMSENNNAKEVILHIGIGKTGTSSIQKMLYDNRGELEKQGYYYPDIGIYECAHHHLADYRVGHVSKGARKLLREVVKKFDRSDNKVLVLSSEQFCFCKPSYIKELAEFFDQWLVKVLFYVRRQEDLISSAFLQQVKEGGDYQGSVLSYFEKWKYAFDYNARLETWASVFGVESIVVRLYHAKEEHYNVCLHFMQAISIKDSIAGETEVRSNQSLLPEFAELVSLLDSMVCTKEYRAEIIKELENLSGIFKASSNRMLLTDMLRPHVDEYYRSSNEIFASKYLSKADAKLFLG
jgi:hypothetical protein